MNIHYRQQIPLEGLGNMESALRARGHQLARTQLYKNELLSSLDKIDWLQNKQATDSR